MDNVRRVSNSEPSESQAYRLAREVTFSNPFMLSDGIGSSGKRLLAHVAGLVDGVEKLTHNPWFETVATLHWMQELSTPTAVGLIRTEADRHTYHLLLGRDVNLRRGETTGIFTNPRPLRYLRRILLQQEGDAAASRVTSHYPIINEGTHDGLRSGPLFAEAFGDRLILLHVLRSPAELALDWLGRGFGTRMGSDPRETQLLLQRGESVEPVLFARERPGLFGSLGPKERVLGMIAFAYEENLRGLLGMPKPSRVAVFSFEEMVTSPESLLSTIEGILGRQRASSPRRLFKREAVPRSVKHPSTLEADLDIDSSVYARNFYRRCVAAHEAMFELRLPLLRT